jgi:glucose-1-phosphate thymidylyltransferase
VTVPNEAVVLAGGEGRRLWPLTTYRPKPLLTVANRPIIDYVIDALRAVDVDRFVIVVGHGHTRLQTHLTEQYPELEPTVLHQERRLGSGHALQQAEAAVGQEFLVVNGDTVISPEIVRETAARAREDGGPAVAVRVSDRPEQYGVVRTTSDGRVETIEERPAETDRYLVNAGVYALDRSVFDALDRTPSRDGELHLPQAIAHLDPATVRTDERWFDPATPWELLDATESLLSSTDRPGAAATVASSASVHETADLGDAVAIGPGCHVGAGAVVARHSCLRANATVEPNAVVRRTVAGEDSHIGSGAVLHDTIVGPGARVGPNTTAPGGPVDVVIDGQFYPDCPVGSVLADRAETGANVTLSSGCRVGPDATVADGATVSGRVDGDAEVVR